MKIVIERVTAMPTIAGKERCETSDGVVHTGPSAIYDAARHLISRGVSPRASLRFVRDGKVCLSGRVEAFASQTWGGNLVDPKSRKWVPDPRYPLAPALQAWWDARNPAGANPTPG